MDGLRIRLVSEHASETKTAKTGLQCGLLPQPRPTSWLARSVRCLHRSARPPRVATTDGLGTPLRAAVLKLAIPGWAHASGEHAFWSRPRLRPRFPCRVAVPRGGCHAGGRGIGRCGALQTMAARLRLGEGSDFCTAELTGVCFPALKEEVPICSRAGYQVTMIPPFRSSDLGSRLAGAAGAPVCACCSVMNSSLGPIQRPACPHAAHTEVVFYTPLQASNIRPHSRDPVSGSG